MNFSSNGHRFWKIYDTRERAEFISRYYDYRIFTILIVAMDKVESYRSFNGVNCRSMTNDNMRSVPVTNN